MHFFKWLIGGIIGGAIGAAAWVGIENATQGEYGWIAWPVGLLVGWGVHKGASGDVRGGFLRGAVAAILALAVIMGAKYSKTAILQAQSKKNSAGIAMKTDVVETQQEEAATTSETPVELPEVINQPAIFQGPTTSRSNVSFNEMDMIWICLAALTAYLVGKGPGPSALPSEASADAIKEDDAELDKPDGE